MVVSRLADQIGRVLSGRYRLIAPLGTGASAQVYLADDVRLRRRVAVKLLHDALAEDEAFLRRFRAEAQAAAALNHPNLLAVYDWGDDEGTPYLVTEHLAGGSLRTMLDQGDLLTPSQAVLIGLEATRALDYAHKRGFVHRDIKPANLLFGDDARLRIADFGLARAIAEAAWTEPQGAVLGTARYASPEQAQGQPVDGRADVYSLGLVLIEAVTGTVPFSADTTIATLMGRVGKPVPVPEEMGPLRKVLERVGQPEPGDRPDAGELGIALMAGAERLPRPEPLPVAVASAVLDLTDSGDQTMLGGTTFAESPVAPTEGPPTVAGATTVVPVPPADPPEYLVDALDASGPPESPRRRWRWALLAAVLAVLLGSSAGWAYDTTRGPTYEVPSVVGQTEQQAVAALAPYDFEVNVEQTRKDGTKPGQVLQTKPAAGESLDEGDTITLVVSQGNTLAAVPTDLVGKPLADATAALKAVGGFTPKVQEVFDENVPKDQVMALGDGAQAQMPKGSEVPLVVSKGPQPRTVPEGLEGGSYDAAAAAIQGAGLKPQKVEEFSDSVAKGQVIELHPGGGSQAARGSTVEVVVSKGPDLVTVPKVDGLTLEQAISRLEGTGLVVGEVSGPAKGRPFLTDPLAGEKAPRGATVDIYLRR